MFEFRNQILFGSIALFLLFFPILLLFVDRASLILFLFYAPLQWMLIYRLSRPIQKILDAISPYQEEKVLPRIVLNEGEFSKLASTLNSLNQRVQQQMDTEGNQRKETEGILDSLSEGVVAFDPTGKVTFANRVASRILSISRGAFLGESRLAKKCHELVLQALQTAERTTESWTEGRGVYLELTSSPLVHQSGAILVLQDRQVGKDFIANASHELRTPITIIRGFAEMLSEFPNMPPAKLRDITQKIVRTSERLDKLIKSLLLLADMENISEKRFVTVDLVALAEHCKHLLLAAYPEVQFTLNMSEPQIYVQADADLLDLVLMNLLENAVRYSTAPAQIEVSIEKQDPTVKLSVADRGIGIPEQDLPYIFGRFYTVDKARSRKSGGSGLGLSIVKTIVEKHGGTVAASSEVGRGSVFEVVLK